jgi:ubiquinone/menaquinone biosynthesis C-methylase UbiE
MKKSYLIEHSNENERLNYQNKIDVYHLDSELDFFSWDKNEVILDAGCGNGNVIEKLLSRGMTYIHGIDFSIDRISEVQTRFEKFSGVKTFHGPLEKTTFSENTYDRIICRYVYEHLTNVGEVTDEFLRVLKPGASLYIIEFDDIFFDFYTKNESFNQQLKNLKAKLPNDFGIAHKLPQLLKRHGMEQVEWDAQTYFFKGTRMEMEFENNKMRLQQGRDHLSRYFNSMEEYDEFAKTYIEEMKDDCNVMKTTKYLIKATKPKTKKLAIVSEKI